jgi:hypothetical protein
MSKQNNTYFTDYKQIQLILNSEFSTLDSHYLCKYKI